MKDFQVNKLLDRLESNLSALLDPVVIHPELMRLIRSALHPVLLEVLSQYEQDTEVVFYSEEEEVNAHKPH